MSSFKKILSENVAEYYNTRKLGLFKSKVEANKIFDHIKKLPAPGGSIFTRDPGISRLKKLVSIVDTCSMEDNDFLALQVAIFFKKRISSSTSIFLQKALLTTFQKYYKIVADSKEVDELYERKGNPEQCYFIEHAREEVLRNKTMCFIFNLVNLNEKAIELQSYIVT